MKRNLFIVFIFFIAVTQKVFASEDNSCAITAYIQNTHFPTMIVTSDGSIWQLFSLAKQKQTWTQWWYNVNPMQPKDEWVCNFSSWRNTDPVRIYHRDRNAEEIPDDFFDTNTKKADFIIEHCSLKEFAFAQKLSIEQFFFVVNQSLSHAYEKGRSFHRKAGFQRGFSQGYITGQTIKPYRY